MAVIGHHFPGYTSPVLWALPWNEWLAIAEASDQIVAERSKSPSSHRTR